MQMKLLCTIAAFALIACTPASTSSSDGAGVAFGKSIVVDGPEIMPLGLLEDSRCPANADCAWPGQVRIKAKWIRPGSDEMIELTSGRPIKLADGELTLTDVKPVRMTTEKIENEDYRFAFRFSGGL